MTQQQINLERDLRRQLWGLFRRLPSKFNVSREDVKSFEAVTVACEAVNTARINYEDAKAVEAASLAIAAAEKALTEARAARRQVDG